VRKRETQKEKAKKRGNSNRQSSEGKMLLDWLVGDAGTSALSLEADPTSGVLLCFPPASRCAFVLLLFLLLCAFG
jgi:hypothetical protein